MYEVFEQLLQKFGVTPYKVRKQTGVTQTTLSNWKKGKSTPSNGIVAHTPSHYTTLQTA